MSSELLPGVSVIIPCHNQGDTLERAAQSALDAGANEVIIVKDGPAHLTDTAEELFREEPNIILTGHFYPQPFGVCWARNVGIMSAHHEWILPLDADDELLPKMASWLLEQAAPNKAIYGDYVVQNTAMPNSDPGMIYRKSVCHATVLFSKEDWRRVGGYKPEFNVGCEDWEFMLSLADAGVKLIHINTPVYRKTINPNGRGAKCLERRPLIASLLKEFHPKVQL